MGNPENRFSAKWIDASDTAVEAVVLKILRQQFRNSVILRVCPHVSIEPRKLVSSATPESQPY
jgi:hypothetical protein